MFLFIAVKIIQAGIQFDVHSGELPGLLLSKLDIGPESSSQLSL